MAWSTTEPSVKTWEQSQSTSWEQNNFRLTTVRSIGRTKGKGFALKVELTVTDISGKSGGFQASGYIYLSAQVGSATAVVDTSTRMPLGTKSYVFYYTDEAASGVSVICIAGWSESSGSRKSVTFTAPKLLGAQAFVNINGSWKQATMFVNVSGSWQEVQTKVNVGGDWK